MLLAVSRDFEECEGGYEMRYGKWEVIREIGRGGQAITYLVRDTTKFDLSELLQQLKHAINILGTVQTPEEYSKGALTALERIEKYLHRESDRFCAALKILHESARKNVKALGRLRKEVETLSQLEHPNLVKILDSSVENGWFVMPYYGEGTLAQHLDRFKGRPQEVLEAFRGLVDGVANLHTTPAVHRDIKPENIFVCDSRLILGDFGIIYFEDAAQTRLSDSYENVGSRDWMPGWAMGMQLDEVRPSFDVFSLGKVLWAMVSGRTKMRLWYYDHDEFNLEKLFPNDERMLWINRLLHGSIQEYESMVWPSAHEMLEQIDVISAQIRRGSQSVRGDAARWCRVCGTSKYQPIITQNSPPDALRRLGIEPVGQHFRIFRCSECGHLDLFQVV
jgi:serine/threonine protein kinase